MVNTQDSTAQEFDESEPDSPVAAEQFKFDNPFAKTKEEKELDAQRQRETLQRCRQTLTTLLFCHDRSDATQNRKDEEFTLHNIRLIDPSFPYPDGARKESGPEYEKITFPALNTPGREVEAAKWLKELFRLKAFDQPPETKEEDLRLWKMQDEIAQATAREPRLFVQMILDQMAALTPGWLPPAMTSSKREVIWKHKLLLEQIYRTILQQACLINPRVQYHLPTNEHDKMINWLQQKTWTVKMYMQFASCLDKGSANQVFNGIKEVEEWKKYGPEMGKAWWDEAMTMLANFPQAYHKEGRLQMIMSGVCAGFVRLPPVLVTEANNAIVDGKAMADFLRKEKLLTEPDWEHLSGMDKIIHGKVLKNISQKAGIGEILDYVYERAGTYRGLRERMVDAIQKTGVLLGRMPEPPAVPTETMIEKITRLEKGVTSPDDALAAYTGESARDPNYKRGRTAPAMALAATRRHITCAEAYRFASQHETDLLTTLSKEGFMKVLRPPAGSSPDDLQEQFEELMRVTDKDRKIFETVLQYWEGCAEAFQNPKACREFQKRVLGFLQEYLVKHPAVQGENWALGGGLRFLARFNYPLAQEWVMRLKDYIEFKDALEIAYAPLLYPDPNPFTPEWGAGLQALENAGDRRTRWHVLPGMKLPQHPRIVGECAALYDELQKTVADALDGHRTLDHEETEDLGRARNRQNDLEEKMENLSWVTRLYLEDLHNDTLVSWRQKFFALFQKSSDKPSVEEYATAKKLLEVADRIDSDLKAGMTPAKLKRKLLDSTRWQEGGYTLLTLGVEKPLKHGTVPPLGKFMQSWMREKEVMAGISLTRKPLPQITAEEYNAEFSAYTAPIRKQRSGETRRSILKKGAAAGVLALIGKQLLDMLTNSGQEDPNRRGHNARNDPTMPGGASPPTLPGVEAMEENPAVVGRLSRRMEGNDQYMFIRYASVEDPVTGQEIPLPHDVCVALSEIGPEEGPPFQRTATLDLTRVRHGSRIPIPFGGAIDRKRFTDGRLFPEGGAQLTPDGFSEINDRDPGAYGVDFRTAPPSQLDGAARGGDIQRVLRQQFRNRNFFRVQPVGELLQTTVDREHLPVEFRNAIAQAEREPAAAATQTIARAVREYLEYDDSVGQTYRDFHAQAPHRQEQGRHPYVEFICTQRKGVCGQFARLTQELLRHAGIPCAMGDCFWAQEKTITTNHFHRVAVAILLDSNGSLIRVPIESTGSSVRRHDRAATGQRPEPGEEGQNRKEGSQGNGGRGRQGRPEGGGDEREEQERRQQQVGNGSERGLIPDNTPLVLTAIGTLAVVKVAQKIREVIRNRMEQPKKVPAAQEKPADVPAKEAAPPMTAEIVQREQIPVKEKAPEFFPWWEAIVHEAFREIAGDPNIVCPDTDACLLYMKVRTCVRDKLKLIDTSNLPSDFITQATSILKNSAVSAFNEKRKEGQFWLERPKSEDTGTE